MSWSVIGSPDNDFTDAAMASGLDANVAKTSAVVEARD